MLQIVQFSLKLLFFIGSHYPPSSRKTSQDQKYQIMDFNKLSICIYTYIHMCWATCSYFFIKVFGWMHGSVVVFHSLSPCNTDNRQL